MPMRFASRDQALDFASRGRNGFVADEAIFFYSLRAHADRSEWLAGQEARKASGRSQRARNFWAQFRVSALVMRGGESRELRPQIASRMRKTNPAVRSQASKAWPTISPCLLQPVSPLR